jgi:hypothetical protein
MNINRVVLQVFAVILMILLMGMAHSPASVSDVAILPPDPVEEYFAEFPSSKEGLKEQSLDRIPGK